MFEDKTIQELRDLVAVRFPGTNGGPVGGWRACTKAEIIEALTSGVVPSKVKTTYVPEATARQHAKARALGIELPEGCTVPQASALITAAEGTPEAPKVPETPKVETPKVAVDTTDDAATLAALLRKLAGAGTVDADTVRAIVQEETAKVLRPEVRNIHLPESKVVHKVEGRQHAIFDDVLSLVALRLHVYLVGPAGTGKSTIAEKVAEALGLRFGAISLDVTMPPSRLFGFIDAGGTYRGTSLEDCYVNGGVFLFDEMDNGHGGILASINMMLSQSQCAFPNGMRKRHPDFVVIAAANTYGTGGTKEFQHRQPLDAATLDRFWQLHVDYDTALEDDLAYSFGRTPEVEAWVALVRQYRANAHKLGLTLSFGPRPIIEGAKAIAAGIPVAKVKAWRLDRGIDPDTLAKLNHR